MSLSMTHFSVKSILCSETFHLWSLPHFYLLFDMLDTRVDHPEERGQKTKTTRRITRQRTKYVQYHLNFLLNPQSSV